MAIAPTEVPADGLSVAHVDVWVRAQNTKLDGKVSLKISSIGVPAHFAQTVLTDLQGHARFEVTSSHTGITTLTAAFDDGLGGPKNSVSARITWIPPTGDLDNLGAQAALISLSLNNNQTQAAADPSVPTMILARLVNKAGAPVAGRKITISALRPGDTVVPTHAITDATGQASILLSAGSEGVATVQVTDGARVQQLRVPIVSGPPDTSLSTWTAQSTNACANSSDTVTLKFVALDHASHPVPFIPVRFFSDQPLDTLLPKQTVTDSLGVATLSVKTTRVGSRTLRAVINQGTLSASASFVPGAVSESHSTIVMDSMNPVADTQSMGSLKAYIKDAFDNPLAGQSVVWTSSDSNVLFAQNNAVSNANGLVTTTITSSHAATSVVTATVATKAIYGAVTFLAGPPVPQKSSITSTARCYADDTAVVHVSGYLADAYGNAAPGIAINLATDGAAVTINPIAPRTGVRGTFEATFASAVVQTTTVTVGYAGNVNQFVIAFIPGPADPQASSFIAQPPSHVPADGTTSIALNLTLKDSRGRTMPATPLAWHTALDGALLQTPSSTTSQTGESSNSIKAHLAGPHAVYAVTDHVVLAAQTSFNPIAASCPANVRLGDAPVFIDVAQAGKFIATNDLNADGHLDLVAGLNDGTLRTFTGNGHGQFALAESITWGSELHDLALVDLNGDGAIDLVAAGQGKVLNTYINNTSGQFSAQTTVTMPAEITNLCSADINQDGAMDLVAVTQEASQPGFYVLFGDGQGGYTGQTFYPLDGAPKACVVHDVDGDGIADVAIINALTGEMDLSFGTPTYTFGDPSHFAIGNNPSLLVAEDLNNDGALDLVVVSESPGRIVTIYFNLGTGDFESRVQFAVEDELNALHLSDLNNDGFLDLIAGTYYDGMAVFLNQGDGNMVRSQFIYQDLNISAIASGDFNEDGNTDLAYLMPSGYLNTAGVSLATSSGVFQGKSQINGDSGNPSSGLFTGDLNGDGLTDLVELRSNGGTYLYQSRGDYTFASIALPEPIAASHMVITDLNADGHLDMVALNASLPQIDIFFGLGDMNFRVIHMSLTHEGATGGGVLAVADLNQDGLMDILVSGSVGVATYLGQSDGHFSFSSLFKGNVGTSPTFCESLFVVDVNNDGINDLVATCAALVVHTGRDDGTFANPVAYNERAYYFPSSLSAVDVNQDGFVDIIGSGAYGIEYAANDGQGGFAPLSTLSNLLSGPMTVGDFNQDGLVDLLIGPQNDQAGNALFLATGGGNFLAPAIYPGGAVGSIIAADFTGNGRLDVVTEPYLNSLVISPHLGCVH